MPQCMSAAVHVHSFSAQPLLACVHDTQQNLKLLHEGDVTRLGCSTSTEASRVANGHLFVPPYAPHLAVHDFAAKLRVLDCHGCHSAHTMGSQDRNKAGWCSQVAQTDFGIKELVDPMHLVLKQAGKLLFSMVDSSDITELSGL